MALTGSSRILPGFVNVAALTVTAFLSVTSTPTLADYTSRLQVGNWSGGAWADANSKQFSNCGLGLKFSSGAQMTLIVTNTLAQVLIITDQRIQAQPQQQVGVGLKFGDAAQLQVGARALRPNMIQIPLPALPHHYDTIRKSTTLAASAPGFNGTLNISGIAQAFPQAIDCAIRERARMANPPTPPGPPLQFEKTEATLAGLVVAERSGIGPYIVFADDKRPGNFKNAAVVTGYVGAQGPGGPANVLTSVYFLDAEPGTTIQDARQNQVSRIKKLNPQAVTGDLPAIPGKPNSAAFWILSNNVYEELHLIQKPGKGFFQFSSSTPGAGRKTAEAAGVKLRAAIALAIPY